MRKAWLSAVVVAVLLAVAAQGRAADQQGGGGAAGFTVARFVVGTGVEKREPVGVAEKFPATQKEVTAFLDATGIAAPTAVTFVWFAGGKEVRQIPGKLEAGKRWRTWAVKGLRGVKGPWKVELRGADGAAVATAGFTVE